MKQLRRLTATVAALLSATTLAACGTPKAGLTGGDEAATVNLHAAADNTGATRTIIDGCNASLNGKVTINLQELTGDDQREQLTRKLSAQDTTVDVMAIPISWAPEFAAAGWVEELRGDNEKQVAEGVPEALLATARYKKDLFGAPWTTDSQMLWYRTDLVPVAPSTWDEMIVKANELAAQDRPHFIEIPGLQTKAVGGLFMALTNSNGAGITDKSVEHAAIGDETKEAAVLLKAFAQSKGFDVAAYNASTETTDIARKQFIEGKAAFLIDSRLAFTGAAMPASAGLTTFPRTQLDQPPRPLLDGTNLAISSYSKHQKQALEAIACLRNEQSARILQIVGGKLPTIDRSGDGSGFDSTLLSGTPPLQTPAGDAVFAAIQKSVSPLPNIDVETINGTLESEINRALDFRAKK